MSRNHLEMFWRTLDSVADIAGITARYEALKSQLDERSRRLVAAAESQAIGKGGISVVARATGLSRPVIRQGIADLKNPTAWAPGRIRREGGGRKRAVVKDGRLCGPIWRNYWNRPPAATRKRRCAGLAGVCAS